MLLVGALASVLGLLLAPQPMRPHVRASSAPSMAAGRAQDWAKLSTFARMALLRSLLDGTASEEVVNDAVGRGLGLIDRRTGAVVDPAGSLPDVFADAELLARLEAALPQEEDEDGIEELASLDMLVEVLHGVEMTRLLVREGDADFAVRRTVVRWLATTQPELQIE